MKKRTKKSGGRGRKVGLDLNWLRQEPPGTAELFVGHTLISRKKGKKEKHILFNFFSLCFFSSFTFCCCCNAAHNKRFSDLEGTWYRGRRGGGGARKLTFFFFSLSLFFSWGFFTSPFLFYMWISIGCSSKCS